MFQSSYGTDEKEGQMMGGYRENIPGDSGWEVMDGSKARSSRWSNIDLRIHSKHMGTSSRRNDPVEW